MSRPLTVLPSEFSRITYAGMQLMEDHLYRPKPHHVARLSRIVTALEGSGVSVPRNVTIFPDSEYVIDLEGHGQTPEQIQVCAAIVLQFYARKLLEHAQRHSAS
jgi:hypothetical protein